MSIKYNIISKQGGVKSMKRKGFTLIELIVVMVIISILVLLGVPKYKEYINQARIT